MGYATATGRRTRTQSLAIVPTGTVTTATANTTGVELGDKGTLRLTLAVTVATGTSPTLAVQMQTSADNSTWRSLGSAFTTATGVTSQSQSFGGVDRFVRAALTVGGTTPSFTWGLTGEAV